jgi:hypothetical protein
MGKCKDCELFKETTVGALSKLFSEEEPLKFDGLCYFRCPPWEPHYVNSEWDMDDCPHYLEFLEQETGEYDSLMYEELKEKGEILNENNC